MKKIKEIEDKNKSKKNFGVKIKPLFSKDFIFKNIIKLISLVVLCILMFFPFSMKSMNLFNKEINSELLYPFTVLFSNAVPADFSLLYLGCLSFFLMPVAFILTFLSLFKKINKVIKNSVIYLFVFITVTLYIFTSLVAMVAFANTPRWFYTLSLLVYIAFFIALAFHIFLLGYGMISRKKRDEAYAEYKSILLAQEQEEKEATAKAIESLKTKQEKTEKESRKYLRLQRQIKKHTATLKHKKRKTHIKTKIAIVFLVTITTVLGTFVYSNLKNYNSLLTQNINTTGTNLAEQVSAIYYFSDGLHAKISAFLEGIKKTNASSPLPFKRVDIIITDSKEAFYLEQIKNSSDLPNFEVFAYTTAGDKLKQISAIEKKITNKQAFNYLTQYNSPSKKNLPHYNEAKDTYLYVYPILFTRKAGERLIGFSVVSYLKEVLDRPYFQVKVFVVALSATFFYLSIIITLLLADYIAKPIIFLTGSIRKTANIFDGMISGNAEIDADKFVFEENVKSNDELKTLSLEIKNIVSLVRGILPYISFHTIRNADKNIANRSYLRDLCFLFTDIRGFTTICENMEARDVTAMLNYYLDLESKIIFDNGGDIDKYVGDEMMAFFSGPKKEINACKAALEIRTAMRKAQIEAVKAGKEPVSIGIGINSGKVVFGPVGSKTRKDYTSIGDAVNLAARLEGVNKAYGTKCIISDTVYKSLNKDFICRELDFIAVKGKNEAVRIYEILQETKKMPPEKLKELKVTFETGLAYYRNKKWDIAKKYFTTCAKDFNDIPAKVFLQRVEHYQANPPKGSWDGVFVMGVK